MINFFKNKEYKIFVIYIGILDQNNNIISNNIGEYCQEVSKKVIPSNVEGEFIIIPIFSQNTKIECINPIYIKNKNLIKEHENLLIKLNNNLNVKSY